MAVESTALTSSQPFTVSATRASEQRQLVGVQILRGLAALAVVVHHALEESQPLFHHELPHALVVVGAAGVDLFFVISGFIMLHTSWSEFGRAGAALRFLARRALRIYPLYLLCLVTVLLGWASGFFYRSLDVNAANLLASTLLLPSGSLIVGVSWTLVFEMYFYGLFAAWLFLRRPSLVVLALPLTLALLALLATALPFESLRLYWANPIVYEFSLGLLVALAFRNGWRLPQQRGALFAAVVAIALAAAWAPALTTAGLEPLARFFCWGIPAALILYSQLDGQAQRSRAVATFERLGDASYSVYLAHGFVLIVYARLLKTSALSRLLPPSAWVTLIVLACVVFGLVVHHAVERPLTRRLKTLFSGARHARSTRSEA